MLTYFVDAGYFIWLLSVLKSSLPFSSFEICWLLWKRCCFGFGWSCIHKCSIKSFIKWVNIYSGWAYMGLMYDNHDHTCRINLHFYCYFLSLSKCVQFCLECTVISSLIWILPFKSQHPALVELLGVISALQATDIPATKFSFRTSGSRDIFLSLAPVPTCHLGPTPFSLQVSLLDSFAFSNVDMSDPSPFPFTLVSAPRGQY